MGLLYDWKRWRIEANANDSTNIFLLCTVYDPVSAYLMCHH